MVDGEICHSFILRTISGSEGTFSSVEAKGRGSQQSTWRAEANSTRGRVGVDAVGLSGK